MSRVERLETTVSGLQRRGDKSVQPKHRTLNLMELRILTHHKYIACPINAIWTNTETNAYDNLLALKLIERCDQTGYRLTNRGEAYMAVLQTVPVLEGV